MAEILGRSTGNHHGTCKGDWGTRLQENPQFILQFAIMIQLTSKRILRDQNEAPEGMFYTIYWVCILSVRVSVIRAILVCLSITLVILEQAQAALEYCFAVQGWRQSYPLTVPFIKSPISQKLPRSKLRFQASEKLSSYCSE